MANEITTTEGAVFIPEIWRPGFLKALAYKGVVRNRVLSADGDVAKMGDILHIRIAPQGVVNNVTAATGAITNQALTPSESQLTVNKWKDYSFDIVDNVKAQADMYLDASLKDSAPQAFAKAIDTDLLALQSTFTTQTAIDATAGLSGDSLTEAFYSLAVDEVNMDDPNNLSWVFHWKQWPVLKKIAGLSEAQITGESGGGLLKFKLPDVLGTPVYFSSAVAESGGEHKNMLFHREAMACGVQKNFNMEQLARVRKSTPYSIDMMYGVKEVRTTHGIVVRTTAA
jgi:HK97 family phage major capsid protein